MKTIELELYSIRELSPEAQQRAIQDWRENEDFSYLWNEANASLERFCDIFNIHRNRNYESYEHCTDERLLRLQGHRLARWIYNNKWSEITKGKYYGKLVNTFPDGTPIPVSKQHPAGVRHVRRYSRITREWGNCPLTGVCWDLDLLEPIFEFMKAPDRRDLEDLLDESLHRWKRSINNEIEACNEDEHILDTLEANEYTFEANGKMRNV